MADETVHHHVQLRPKVESQYDDDVAFGRVLDLFLPRAVQDAARDNLTAFAGAVVSPQVLGWLADAEEHLPYMNHWDSWGETNDVLRTSKGWNNLWNFASSASSQFHLTLSDGVAHLLSLHLAGSKLDSPTRALFQHAHGRLTSANPSTAWTSGLWMTERGGGSDLTPTETTATYEPRTETTSGADADTDADGFPLGPWRLDGFKWFSTGTEAAMAIVVAKTAKGLSTFYVPTRRRVLVNGTMRTELNGVRIRRLKNKLGTKALPTAELEINGMRGWLIGEDGRGVKELGVVLNVTRVHLAVFGLGVMGRALAATRAFARVRRVARGTKLSSVPLHMRTLAKAHVTYRGHMLLGFFVASLLAHAEQQTGQQTEQQTRPERAAKFQAMPQSPQDVQCLLRLLSPVAKATTAKALCTVSQVAMEALGGVGYMENEDMRFNLARHFRDAPALTIGEGTTDVLATDVVKVLKGSIGPAVVRALGRWVTATLPAGEATALERDAVVQQWNELDTAISSNTVESLTLHGQEIMDHVRTLVAAVLLLVAFETDADPVTLEIARRWMGLHRPLGGWTNVETELSIDQKIVFGSRPTWDAEE
ncbi:hypothetical protein SBRCBS47491_006943 [Sporothrix bragantina]|uniref:Acyl-CoA dehydrogenase n=1 Tax=Sporothrix bragantina TaxID=671064 RepID=A0ABP0C949_9PEZI